MIIKFPSLAALLLAVACAPASAQSRPPAPSEMGLSKPREPEHPPEEPSGAPVIGVLTQVLRDYRRFSERRHLHIAASYVKWLEGSGAQVLPILLNQDDAYYRRAFQQTNGLLLPGGDNLLDPAKSTPMLVAARKLWALALAANQRGDHYPIWGTCLGLELLSVLASERNVLEQCHANDMALGLRFSQRGRLFAPTSQVSGLPLGRLDYAELVVEALAARNLTYNYHHKCLTDQGLRRARLDNFYRPIAYSRDAQGLEFIAVMEALDYPFYGVQFHPEKAAYEFVVKHSQRSIPHGREPIAVSRYFADYFVDSARKSGHGASNQTELATNLIYAHDPLYTAPMKDMYEQRYLFPYPNSTTTTDEEFLDYKPAQLEEAPEPMVDDHARAQLADPVDTK